ncbi:hypothetical protein DUT91_23730 [Phyllobacterium salinisoli]|uniref:Uncharacterized protein n=2 Tax=Phyllobacterium salinisoli TaxID=1899321 RepID=A0A368JWD8_9HYPH|nr:hypothetical protein DUT91_23730 [Phyllobacterium salinisoli]
MQRDDGAIIIGNAVDLPTPYPQSGAQFAFTASDPRAPQLAQEQSRAPLIASLTEWPQGVEATVAARVEARPSMEAATGRLEAAVAAVWQQPQAVLAELRNRVDVQQTPVSAFASDMRTKPDSFGELHGAETSSAATTPPARRRLPPCRWPSQHCTTMGRCVPRLPPTSLATKSGSGH